MTIFDDVEAELARATKLYGAMRSPHEGYAVLLEEVDELWDEVKDKHSSRKKMREEAIQVAAMAIRFIMDCCLPTHDELRRRGRETLTSETLTYPTGKLGKCPKPGTDGLRSAKIIAACVEELEKWPLARGA